MTDTIQVPEGYIKDSRDNLIKRATVKPIDLLRDELVKKIVDRGRVTAETVASFKADAFEEIQDFVEMSAEEYGVKLGGKKGNVTLTSFDGQYRVALARDENTAFDERLSIGQQLIRDCLDELLDGSRPEVRTIVDKAFQTNKAGEVSVASIMGLRNLKIDHPKWTKAMDVLADSINVVGRRTYIRLYKREGETEKYRQISLDGSEALPAETK